MPFYSRNNPLEKREVRPDSLDQTTNPLLKHADNLWPRQVERPGGTLSLQLTLKMHQNLMVQAANFLRLNLRWELTNQAWVTPLVRQRDAGGSKRRHDRIQLVT